MRRRSWIKWTAITALVIAVSTAFVVHKSLAAPSYRGGFAGHFRGGHGTILAKIASLGITDEQREKIHAILLEAKPKAEPLIKQLVAERRALRDLVLNNGSEAEIRAQAQKIAAVGADLAVLKASVAPQVRAVLTPNQQEKIKEMIAEFDDRIDTWLDHLGNVE